MRPTSVVLVGPTATGKTAVAMALAAAVPGCEVVNADSRQVIRGLDIATATPGRDLRDRVPHHLYDMREPGAAFSAADWLDACESVMAGIRERSGIPIVVGGTGLYISALIDGLDPLPAADPAVRTARNALAAEPGGLLTLTAELATRDPDAAASIDLANPRRVMRALEIIDATGAPLAAAWTRRAAGRQPLPESDIYVGLDLDQPTLVERIAERAAAMFRTALFAEVAAALERGSSPAAIADSGIGYAEALGVMNGARQRDAALATVVARTARYAKAQRTFFRRDKRIRWLDAALPAPDIALAILHGVAAGAD